MPRGSWQPPSAIRYNVAVTMKDSKNVVPFDRAERSRGTLGALLGNPTYVEELYQQWRENPASVLPDWDTFFAGFDFAASTGLTVSAEEAHAQAQVASLISAYRNQGHLIADLDPLGDQLQSLPGLELPEFGFSESDLDRVFDVGSLVSETPRITLRELLDILRATYCNTVGVEYRHIQDRSIRHWLETQMEPLRNSPRFSRDEKMHILKRLIDAEIFETFIQSRYPGQKRFSLEGGESVIPALDALMELAPELGIESLILGMAHRGRLNVLANILDKPYALIFTEFEDTNPLVVGGDGDVKYHRGYYCERITRSGRKLAISLASNPSHLEAVDPVVEGRVRAKQRRLGDTEERGRVLPLLIHGDAAFAGQGLVAETLNLSQLEGYRTGGTVHFIINNQIGFTTAPEEGRSTRYPTDVAKMIEAPIFHVNGDDPQAVVHVTRLALRFRQRYKKDVVVDMICYRRHGHNEGDEPAYTQPHLYRKIKDRPSVRRLYTRNLVDTGALSPKQGEKIANGFKARLQKAFEAAKQEPPEDTVRPFDRYWEGLGNPYSHDPVQTGTSHDILLEVARALTTLPEGFQLNPKVARKLPDHLKAIQDKGEVDWPLAELLSLGSLLAEGSPVRLSGQDSARGTFSQRHAKWRDMVIDDPQRGSHVPLNHIKAGQARFCLYNSMLSEAAVLGFDYGYSLGEPYMLVMWEAQFGDFANGAQVIIDQFIVSSQAKWNRTSGLVMLLPHGYEGQGPEHSNAYLERYLAACADDNIQVCNLTTPAQYFHVLRRQLRRNFRRPLIIMTPKSLLRHPRCVSPVRELMEGRFHEFLDDPWAPSRPKRLLLCSGKVYYDLLEKRESEQVDGVAIVRVEQFHPFHRGAFQQVVQRYGGAAQICWVQEEPQNRGGWTFMFPILLDLFPREKLNYVGRRASASPATGSLKIHRREQEELVCSALGLG